MQALADFSFEVIDDVVVIFDLDRGGRSVTNDIEAVLHYVDDEVGGLGARRVIYRDSTKTFDGIYHDGKRFRGFYSINATILNRPWRHAHRATGDSPMTDTSSPKRS